VWTRIDRNKSQADGEVNTVSETLKTEAFVAGRIQYKYCGWEIVAVMMYSYLYKRSWFY